MARDETKGLKCGIASEPGGLDFAGKRLGEVARIHWGLGWAGLIRVRVLSFRDFVNRVGRKKESKELELGTRAWR